MKKTSCEKPAATGTKQRAVNSEQPKECTGPHGDHTCHSTDSEHRIQHTRPHGDQSTRPTTDSNHPLGLSSDPNPTIDPEHRIQHIRPHGDHTRPTTDTDHPLGRSSDPNPTIDLEHLTELGSEQYTQLVSSSEPENNSLPVLSSGHIQPVTEVGQQRPLKSGKSGCESRPVKTSKAGNEFRSTKNSKPGESGRVETPRDETDGPSSRQTYSRWQHKYRRLKRWAKQLIYLNAAYCDEVLSTEVEISKAVQETRYLVSRLSYRHDLATELMDTPLQSRVLASGQGTKHHSSRLEPKPTGATQNSLSKPGDRKSRKKQTAHPEESVSKPRPKKRKMSESRKVVAESKDVTGEGLNVRIEGAQLSLAPDASHTEQSLGLVKEGLAASHGLPTQVQQQLEAELAQHKEVLTSLQAGSIADVLALSTGSVNRHLEQTEERCRTGAIQASKHKEVLTDVQAGSIGDVLALTTGGVQSHLEQQLVVEMAKQTEELAHHTGAMQAALPHRDRSQAFSLQGFPVQGLLPVQECQAFHETADQGEQSQVCGPDPQLFTVTADQLQGEQSHVCGQDPHIFTVQTPQLLKNLAGTTGQLQNLECATGQLQNLEDATGQLQNLEGATGQLQNLEGATGQLQNLEGVTGQLQNLEGATGQLQNLEGTTGQSDGFVTGCLLGSGQSQNLEGATGQSDGFVTGCLLSSGQSQNLEGATGHTSFLHQQTLGSLAPVVLGNTGVVQGLADLDNSDTPHVDQAMHLLLDSGGVVLQPGSLTHPLPTDAMTSPNHSVTGGTTQTEIEHASIDNEEVEKSAQTTDRVSCEQTEAPLCENTSEAGVARGERGHDIRSKCSTW